MRIGGLEVVALVAIAGVLLLMMMSARSNRPVGAELTELFGDPVSPSPGPNAKRWALGVLWEAGVDADSDPAYAAGILREARLGLSQQAARALVAAIS